MTKVEFVWPGKLYGSHRHITAGELRECGIQIPKHIPDCAWTDRTSISFGEVNIERGDDPDMINMSVNVEVGQPFSWGRMEVEIDADPEAIIEVLREAK